MDAPSSPQTNPSPRDPMFGAFVAPQKRKYWPWALGVTAFFVLAVVLAARQEPGAYNLVTPKGIKTVRLEMTPTQVSSVLGRPIANLSSDGCYHYGWPKLEKDFDVYRVCYQDGRVREVKTVRYEVRRVLGEDEEMPEPPPPPEEVNVWGEPAVPKSPPPGTVPATP